LPIANFKRNKSKIQLPNICANPRLSAKSAVRFDFDFGFEFSQKPRAKGRFSPSAFIRVIRGKVLVLVLLLLLVLVLVLLLNLAKGKNLRAKGRFFVISGMFCLWGVAFVWPIASC
jgi:hypothetical protein